MSSFLFFFFIVFWTSFAALIARVQDWAPAPCAQVLQHNSARGKVFFFFFSIRERLEALGSMGLRDRPYSSAQVSQTERREEEHDERKREGEERTTRATEHSVPGKHGPIYLALVLLQSLGNAMRLSPHTRTNFALSVCLYLALCVWAPDYSTKGSTHVQRSRCMRMRRRVSFHLT